MTDQHTNLCCATLYDQGFATIGRFCRNSMIQYGRRQGYDVVHSPGGTSDRPISWHKLQLIESLFDTGYEFVFWVDADAVFVDFEPDVADLIQPGKHLYFARPKIDGRYFPNMGIFMLRNCDWSRDLIRQLWSLEQYIDHPWWETAAMKHLLYRDTFADHGIVNFNGPHLSEEHLQWIPDRWNYLPRVTQDSPAVIKHFAGNPMKKRLRRMLLNVNLAKQAWAASSSRFIPLAESKFPATICVDRFTGQRLGSLSRSLSRAA